MQSSVRKGISRAHVSFSNVIRDTMKTRTTLDFIVSAHTVYLPRIVAHIGYSQTCGFTGSLHYIEYLYILQEFCRFDRHSVDLRWLRTSAGLYKVKCVRLVQAETPGSILVRILEIDRTCMSSATSSSIRCTSLRLAFRTLLASASSRLSTCMPFIQATC